MKASNGQNIFQRDSIVSLKTEDGFIAKQHQSRHPLRDKYPIYCLFFLRDKDQSDDAALHFRSHVFYHTKDFLSLSLSFYSRKRQVN